MNDNAINALLLTLIAGGATSIGAMLTFFVKQHNFRVLALGMSFSAGVMIYLSFMDILPMAIENMSASNEASKLGHILAVVTFFIGVFIAGIIDHFVPEHLNSDDDPKHNKKNYASKKAHRAAILTALALAIHNFPEGFSVFVSSIENITVGIGVAIAIILHNIPEGISVAMPIYSATGNRAKAFWIATASGMAEPLGALVAYLVLAPIVTPMISGIALAVTAGLMVYIALDELLPMAREYGEEHYGIFGTFAGMALMAFVSIFFGH